MSGGILVLLGLVLLSLVVGAALAWLSEPGKLTVFYRQAKRESLSGHTTISPATNQSKASPEDNTVSNAQGASRLHNPSDGNTDSLSSLHAATPRHTTGSGKSEEARIRALIEAVNHKLPQTQCAQCGYPGCRPYAAAIVTEDVAINQCPPGGDALIAELAEFLGKPVIALDAERGDTKPAQVAYIDEAACIGCVLCIAACPVDAIVGAPRYMHTVISDYCTGCELCLPPCPVDCIELKPSPEPLSQWQWPKPL